MTLSKREKELLDWLDERDGTYVSMDELEEKFGDVDVRLIGVTMKLEDGKSHCPKRDIRQAVKYGVVRD